MKPAAVRSTIRAAARLTRGPLSRLQFLHGRQQSRTLSKGDAHRRTHLTDLANPISTCAPRRWMSSAAAKDSSSGTTSGDDGTKWMYVFAGLMVGANFFTVWQESDAHEKAEQRAAEFEANKLAWEERERRETQQLNAR